MDPNFGSNIIIDWVNESIWFTTLGWKLKQNWAMARFLIYGPSHGPFRHKKEDNMGSLYQKLFTISLVNNPNEKEDQSYLIYSSSITYPQIDATYEENPMRICP